MVGFAEKIDQGVCGYVGVCRCADGVCGRYNGQAVWVGLYPCQLLNQRNLFLANGRYKFYVNYYLTDTTGVVKVTA